MTDTDETALIRKLAVQLIDANDLALINPAVALAALELASAKITLTMDEPDEARAAAAELFERAAGAELEEMASANLTPWADSPWADEPIPFELTAICPTCQNLAIACGCPAESETIL